MKRALFIMGMFAACSIAAYAADAPQLKIFIVSNEAGKGLHAVSYPAFPKLGYIGEKPDLVITEIVRVAYGSLPGYPKPDGGSSAPREDRRSLQIILMPKDAAILNKLTSDHIGARILLMLDNEPLVAPEIKTPLVGQLLYISRVPTGLNTEELKAKLEKLVQKSSAPAASPTTTSQPSATGTPKKAG